VPGELGRRVGIPREKVEVEVGNARADHGREDEVSAQRLLQRTAQPRRQDPHGRSLLGGEVGKRGRVPLRLDEDVADVDVLGDARRRLPDVAREQQVVVDDRPARDGELAAVLPTDEAVLAQCCLQRESPAAIR
jgi:hypothetical protein